MKQKYALIDLDKLQYADISIHDIGAALSTLKSAGLLIEDKRGSEDEFFVIKLKDENADKAISAYGVSCSVNSPELLPYVEDKLKRAGKYSPFCKKPD